MGDATTPPQPTQYQLVIETLTEANGQGSEKEMLPAGFRGANGSIRMQKTKQSFHFAALSRSLQWLSRRLGLILVQVLALDRNQFQLKNKDRVWADDWATAGLAIGKFGRNEKLPL